MIDYEFNTKRAVDHLMDLLAIEGISGEEKSVAERVKAKLIESGCSPDWIFYDNADSRIPEKLSVGNLIVNLPGTVMAERQLFIGHLDTVPLCRRAIPIMKGNKIIARDNTGLGADNRTAVACLVSMIETILLLKLPHPPLTILFSVGEEVGLLGTRSVTVESLGSPKWGFNIDSGRPEELIVGAVGADRWEVHINGLSSHAGVHPEEGVSAMLIASLAIAEVAQKGYFGKIEINGKEGTANVGVISGGEATNQVTDYVYIKGESRSFDPVFIEEINQTYRDAFEMCTHRVKNSRGKSGTVKFLSRKDYHPFRLPDKSKVVINAMRAARSLGLSPRLVTVTGGLDANALNEKGIPTITLGAGQHNAHTLNEYVDLDEYLIGCRLAIALATAVQEQ